MRRIAPFALLMLSLAFAPQARAEEARVTLLHTTDVHGSLLPWDDLAQKPAPRGLARAATLVARIRAEGAPVLLLDNGDATAGSPTTTVWHQDPAGAAEPVTAVMNAMGYDAMSVGNHEFDFGPAALEAARKAAKFPMLAANITRADGAPAFDGTWVKVLANGVRVGVIGLCTPAVPQLADSAKWAGYTFGPAIDAARKAVAGLRGDQHCDVVVALAHTGLEKDTRTGDPVKGYAPGENFGWQLAHEVAGIDVVILGHTHTVIPYAHTDRGGALVTQAGKSAENLGRVDLVLTRDAAGAPWTLKSSRGYVLALGDTVPADPAIAALVAPYAARTRAALDQVVATAKGELAAPAGLFADNALWQLVHRAQLAATGADVSLAAMFDATQKIAAGPVRVRDLMRLYPYDNSLVTVELTGAGLRAALEQSVRDLATYSFDESRLIAGPGLRGYNFDMAMGVTYTVDLTKPAGERITGLARDGKPVADGDRLRVVVNGYRAAGGGDFAMIRDARRAGTCGLSAPEAVLAYAKHTATLTSKVQTTWSLRPAWLTAPERPLIERLVHQGLLGPREAIAFDPNVTATKADVAQWTARVLDRPAPAAAPNANADATVADMLAACERAAQGAKLALGAGKGAADSFRRGLLTGTGARAGAQPLTIAQCLGIAANLRFPQLRLIETTDFHGAILGGTRERRTNRGIGGSVALAAAVARLRAENPEGTLLLDGGDMFQGTMISNLQFGRPVVEQMNALGYTAAAIGNHDYDWSADTLKARVLAMHFPAYGANIIERKSGKRPWWVRSDTMFVRRGVRIGLFGLAYPGTPFVTLPANVAHLRFDDDSAAAAAIAPRLRKAGADVVVEIGHTPAETDSTRKVRGDLLRLAQVPGVDAWFGGHSHNFVDDTVNGSAVLIGASNGQALAVCDLTVDALEHKVIENKHRVATIYADEDAPDSAWVARVKGWNANVEPIAATVLGTSAVELTRGRPEATIGDFICDAMRFASGADIAMQNPGGMRANLPAGTITRGLIYAVMPFDNTIVTLKLTGAEVRKALEQGLGGGRVTQVGGIRYTYDESQPPGSRVGVITLADGKPLDDAATYKVAVNNFMATGGDNYNVLNRGTGHDDGGYIIRGALEDYVREKCRSGAALEIKEDGRIRQLR